MKRLSILLLPAILLGCASQGSQVPPPGSSQTDVRKPAETFRFKDFDLSVSKDWKLFDMASPTLREDAENAEKANIQLVGIAAQVLAVKKNALVKLLAFDTSSGDPDFLNNFNALVAIPPTGSTLEQLVKGGTEEITKYTGSPPSSGQSGPFKTLNYVMNGPDGKPLHALVYMALANDKAYTFQFTCRPKYKEAFQASAEEIMNSVVLK